MTRTEEHRSGGGAGRGGDGTVAGVWGVRTGKAVDGWAESGRSPQAHAVPARPAERASTVSPKRTLRICPSFVAEPIKDGGVARANQPPARRLKVPTLASLGRILDGVARIFHVLPHAADRVIAGAQRRGAGQQEGQQGQPVQSHAHERGPSVVGSRRQAKPCAVEKETAEGPASS